MAFRQAFSINCCCLPGGKQVNEPVQSAWPIPPRIPSLPDLAADPFHPCVTQRVQEKTGDRIYALCTSASLRELPAVSTFAIGRGLSMP